MKFLYFSLILILFFHIEIHAQTGILDTNFGSNGVSVIEGSKVLTGIAGAYPLKNGKIMSIVSARDTLKGAGSELAFARFNADGSIDTTFKGKGFFIAEKKRSLGLLITDNFTVQSDGKILVGGARIIGKDSSFAIIERYEENGAIDTTFGNKGSFVLSQYFDGFISKPIILPDNKILGIGEASDTITGEVNIILTRCNKNGQLDKTFGNQGITLAKIAEDLLFTNAHDYGILSDNKILIEASYLDLNLGKEIVVLVRFTANGMIDSTFGGVGYIPIDLLCNIKILQNDKILIVGQPQTISSGLEKKVILMRLLSDGTLDKTFATNGKQEYKIPLDRPRLNKVILQPDGKILTSIQCVFNNKTLFSIIRFNQDGTIDSIFGQNGYAQFGTSPSIGSNHIILHGNIFLDKKNQIISFNSLFSSQYGFVIARYLNDVKVKTNDVEKKDLIRIYPNPGTDFINIGLKNKENLKGMEIQFYNSFGSLVFSQSLNNLEFINCSTWAIGIYTYQILDNGKLLQVGKWIKI